MTLRYIISTSFVLVDAPEPISHILPVFIQLALFMYLLYRYTYSTNVFTLSIYLLYSCTYSTHVLRSLMYLLSICVLTLYLHLLYPCTYYIHVLTLSDVLTISMYSMFALADSVAYISVTRLTTVSN